MKGMKINSSQNRVQYFRPKLAPPDWVVWAGERAGGRADFLFFFSSHSYLCIIWKGRRYTKQHYRGINIKRFFNISSSAKNFLGRIESNHGAFEYTRIFPIPYSFAHHLRGRYGRAWIRTSRPPSFSLSVGDTSLGSGRGPLICKYLFPLRRWDGKVYGWIDGMEGRGRGPQWDIRKRGGKGGGGLHCRSNSAPCEKWSAIGRKRKSREGRGEISRLYALYLGEGEKIMRSHLWTNTKTQNTKKIEVCALFWHGMPKKWTKV